MKYGRTCPKGFLPVFSVDTEEEAEALLARCCERVTVGPNYELGYVANELEAEQTLENLYAFGDRLAAGYEAMTKERKRCQ